jgi:chromosome partitioning protein
MEKKGKVVAITNQKGGVGKTTTAIAMAAVLAKRGKRTLLIDCDDSGNPSLSKTLSANPETMGLTDIMLNRINLKSVAPKTPILDASIAVQHSAEGMDFIAADDLLPGISSVAFTMLNSDDKAYILKDITDSLKKDYDYIILDAAPALNVLSTNLLTAADEVVITTQAQGASEEGIAALIATISQVRKSSNPGLVIRGLLLTMVDSRTNYSKRKMAEITSDYSGLGIKVFRAVVPRSVKTEECMEAGKSIISYAPRSKVATAYISFVSEFSRAR